MSACKLSVLFKTLDRYFKSDHVSPAEFEQMVFDVGEMAKNENIDRVAELEILVRKMFLADNESPTAPASNPQWREAYLEVQRMTNFNHKTSVFDPNWNSLHNE